MFVLILWHFFIKRNRIDADDVEIYVTVGPVELSLYTKDDNSFLYSLLLPPETESNEMDTVIGQVRLYFTLFIN